MYLHPVPKSFTPPPFQPSIRIGGRLKLQHPVDGSSLFARGRKRSPPLETYNYNFRASSARDSISVEIGNEAKRSSSGGCKGYDDTSYQRQYISIFLLHSLSFQNFQALYFFLSFFSLRFEEGESRNESFSLREFACTKTMRNLLKFRVAVHPRYSRRDAASPPRVE